MNSLVRKQIFIKGIVQGVGFRPYVYRIASELKLTGYVLNDATGVSIEIQSSNDNVDIFISRLKASPPPLSRVDSIIINVLPIIINESSFVIKHSNKSQSAIVMVSPDKSSCPDCLTEIIDPNNRHYQYPFTNCTNCGPRYSIINELPYDRCNTTMAKFAMCPDCKNSYKNPLDRRYHAQPVSCPICGPQITIKTNTGKQIQNSNNSAIDMVAESIKAGKILAIKGLGGFHLICDATNNVAVATLRNRKQRPFKPLAVMVANIDIAKTIAVGNEAEWNMLNSIEKPIVLLSKLQHSLLADLVAPNIDKIGLFLPYTPLYQIIIDKLELPLVATSANLSGEPIIGDCAGIVKHLSKVVDLIVDNDRDITNCCDDSVVQFNSELQILRLARGFAPFSIHLDKDINTNILAVGAQQKNTICLGFEQNMLLSPHIGDLFSIEATDYFVRTLQTFKRLYQFEPNILVADLHPKYSSTQWAKNYADEHNITFIQVQHHYAHILSIMAKNNYVDNVLGFAFDGTGLGDDGSLWGGEVFIANVHNYERIVHLQQFKLIGGEQAIKRPSRLFLALLFEFYSLDEVLMLPLNSIQKIDKQTIKNLYKIWQQSDCLYTSSIGRLFDAIAYSIDLVDVVTYDGEAGLQMECFANQLLATSPIKLDFPIENNVIQLKPAITKLVSMLSATTINKQLQSEIASGFMLAIVDIIATISNKYPDLPIVLSGGVFQNKYLHVNALKILNNHRHLSSGEIPVNDGGISLGQMWYAIHNQQK